MGSIPGVRNHHVTTRAPGQLSSDNDLELILHAFTTLVSRTKIEATFSQRHRTIIHHGHYGVFFCIWNGVSIKSTNIPSSHCLIYFFFVLAFFCHYSERCLLGFGESGFLFLSGKHTRTVVAHYFQLKVWISFSPSTPHHMAGPRAGIWMHLQLGRDLIQAACISFDLFPFRLLWFLQEKRNLQQCTMLS